MSDISRNQACVSNTGALRLRERFSPLLKEFSTLAAISQLPHDPDEARVRTLLEDFGEVCERAEATDRARAAKDHRRIDELLSGYRNAEAHYRRQQEEYADDFNLLAVMQESIGSAVLCPAVTHFGRA